MNYYLLTIRKTIEKWTKGMNRSRKQLDGQVYEEGFNLNNHKNTNQHNNEIPLFI